MQVIFNDPAGVEAFAQVMDVGDFKDRMYRRGVRLHAGVATELPDDDVTMKSIADGELRKLVVAGKITLVNQPTRNNFTDVQVGDNATTVFTLPAPYMPGTNTLHVFVAGTLQPKAGIYAETDEVTVTFAVAPGAADEILFMWSTY